MTVGFDPIEYDPVMWNKGKERPIIHVDCTPAEMDADYWPAVELVGDTAATITALAGSSSTRTSPFRTFAELGSRQSDDG